jgi:hypothetical protein
MACGHFSDIGFVTAAKKRGFCRLRLSNLAEIAPGDFSGHHSFSAGKKRDFCRLCNIGQRKSDMLRRGPLRPLILGGTSRETGNHNSQLVRLHGLGDVILISRLQRPQPIHR